MNDPEENELSNDKKTQDFELYSNNFKEDESSCDTKTEEKMSLKKKIVLLSIGTLLLIEILLLIGLLPLVENRKKHLNHFTPKNTKYNYYLKSIVDHIDINSMNIYSKITFMLIIESSVYQLIKNILRI